MLIAFPAMHQALAAGLPPAVRLVDPGLDATGAARCLRPESLPLDGRQARRAMAEMMQLGEQFAHIRDLSLLRTQNGLLRRHQPGTSAPSSRTACAAGTTRRSKRARVNAQTELLLAYTFEERQLELAEIESGVAAAGARFQAALGLDEDDSELAGLGLAGTAGSAPAEVEQAPWRPVLAAMLAFLPEDALPVTDQARVADDLAEAGLTLVPAEPADLEAWGLSPVRGPAFTAEAPGFALCGLGRADPGRPWLTAPRRIVYLPGEGA